MHCITLLRLASLVASLVAPILTHLCNPLLQHFQDERRKRERQTQVGGTQGTGTGEGTGAGAGGTGAGGTGAAGGTGTSKDGKEDKDKAMSAKRYSTGGNLFLSLPYATHDLTGLMDVNYRFTGVQIKHIFKQLLGVIGYMHKEGYVHRDLKCSNILLGENFEVKLADFGLARCIEKRTPWEVNTPKANKKQEEIGGFTNKVITLWYRPPELLLGGVRYSKGVDMWSAGCIFAELICGRPILPGKAEIEQLGLIEGLVGSLDGMKGFREYKIVKTGEWRGGQRRENNIRARFGKRMEEDALRLLEKMLAIDPTER